MSASAFFTCFSLSGHMGLPMTQGSTITVAPSLVSMRKVAWPSHVMRLPCRFMVPPIPLWPGRILVAAAQGCNLRSIRQDDLRKQLQCYHAALFDWLHSAYFLSAVSPAQNAASQCKSLL